MNKRQQAKLEINKIRMPAIQAVHKAIKQGRLNKLDGSVLCVDCKEPAIHYDHRDYGKPLDVQPVCGSCNCKRGSASDIVALLKKTVHEKICVFCKNKFKSKRSDALYCSSNCKVGGWALRHITKNKV